MRVQPVLSHVLLHEIQASDGRNRLTLLERVSKLRAPLLLDEAVGWDALATTPNPEFHTALIATSTRASAASAAARTGTMTPEQAQSISAELGLPPPCFDAAGGDTALLKNVLVLIREQFDSLGVETPPIPEELDALAPWSDTFLEAIREKFPEHMARVELLPQMFDSTGVGGQSLGTVASGSAGKKALARVRDRAQDSEHMTLFALHHDQVDYLQLDGVRWRQLNSNSRHALRQRGLQHRCFTGGASVSGVVNALNVRVEEFGWPATDPCR